MPRNEEKDGPPLDENGLYRPRKPTVSDHVCLKKIVVNLMFLLRLFFRDGIDSTVKNNLLRGPIICTNSKCILIFLEIDTIHAVIYNETLQAHSHNLSPIIATLAVA